MDLTKQLQLKLHWLLTIPTYLFLTNFGGPQELPGQVPGVPRSSPEIPRNPKNSQEIPERIGVEGLGFNNKNIKTNETTNDTNNDITNKNTTCKHA